MGPQVAARVKQADDLSLRIVDVTKEGWEAPVVEQFGVRALPHFLLFDSSGNLISEGQEAYQAIMRWGG